MFLGIFLVNEINRFSSNKYNIRIERIKKKEWIVVVIFVSNETILSIFVFTNLIHFDIALNISKTSKKIHI